MHTQVPVIKMPVFLARRRRRRRLDPLFDGPGGKKTKGFAQSCSSLSRSTLTSVEKYRVTAPGPKLCPNVASINPTQPGRINKRRRRRGRRSRFEKEEEEEKGEERV